MQGRPSSCPVSNFRNLPGTFWKILQASAACSRRLLGLYLYCNHLRFGTIWGVRLMRLLPQDGLNFALDDA
jgi:hypothetical protein